ncbi:MAG TPA: hypothetical protein PKG95_01970 [Anaerolineaceae bacterium]|nr:hypothetical protein [Anaerolineaceae bacterium]
MTNPEERVAASFRDPAGFLFRHEGQLYRQVNRAGEADFHLLMDSGLYAALTKAGLLIPHREVEIPPAVPELAALIIQPETVEFISYPYEWSFSQLQDAALVTLAIQRRALDRGLSLKDASAYNIQFHCGRPRLIDTLSFERYNEGQPWTAYRQFCQHFLAPLALMAKRDIRLNQLLRIYIDGVPLDLASKLLPGSTRFNLALLTHIHAHAGVQKRYADRGGEVKASTTGAAFTRNALFGLIDSLEAAVKALRWKPAGTEWADYYDANNYTRAAFDAKSELVSAFLAQAAPHTVWDLGSNTGVFSRLAAARGAQTIAFDIDPAAVDQNYRQGRSAKETLLLPLVMDLTNPSPALGWNHQERLSLAGRGPANLVMALALVHHLAIANNVPLPQLAEFFAGLSEWLIIEFVPKGDSQVDRLLSSRADIFPDYTPEGFEKAFASCFTITAKEDIPDSHRILYLLKRR